MTTKPQVFLGRMLAAVVVVCLAAGLGRTAPPELPKKTKDLIEKAGKEFEKGKIDKALELLEEAKKDRPTLPPAELMLARFFLATNNADVRQAARFHIEAAAKESPNHPAVLLTCGNIAVSENRFTEAVLCCEAALKYAESEKDAEQKKSYQVDANTGLAAVAAARQEWDKARDHLSKVLALDESNGDARHNYARALFMLDSEKNSEKAYEELKRAFKDQKAALKKALEKDPLPKDKEEPVLQIPEASMADFWSNKEIKVDKGMDKEKAKKAREEIYAKYVKEAKKWFERAVDATVTDKEKVQTYLVYAEWLLKQNELGEARLNAQAAADILGKDRETVPCLRVLALIARAKGDYAKAEEYLNRLLYNSPGDWWSTNQLALVLADGSEEQAKLKKALELAENLVNNKQYQRMAEVWATLGWVCYRSALVLPANKKALLAQADKALGNAISSGQLTSDMAYYVACILEMRRSDLDKESPPKDAKAIEELDKKIKDFLEKAQETKGLFIYKREAKKLLKDVEKRETPAGKTPAEKAPDKK